jgi:hypothetical protein
MTALPFTGLAATTINVDFNSSDGAFGTYTGVAAAPDPGTVWNGFAIGPEGGSPLIGSATSGVLATSTGLPAPVTVTLGNFRVYEAQENAAAQASALMTDFGYQQNLGTGGPDSTFAINNLNPAFTYDLYLYAQNGGYGNTATIFTIGGNQQIASNAGNIGSFIQNTNYVLYSGLVPDGAGTISGTFNDFAVANNAAFNGLQIVEIVPEPEVLSLAGLAGLIGIRRRRSRH